MEQYSNIRQYQLRQKLGEPDRQIVLHAGYLHGAGKIAEYKALGMWHPNKFVIRAEDIAASSDDSSQPAGQMVLTAGATNTAVPAAWPQAGSTSSEPSASAEEETATAGSQAGEAEEAGEADKAEEEAEARAEAQAQAEDTAAVEAASADANAKAKASAGTEPAHNRAEDRPAAGAVPAGQREVEAVGGGAESAKKDARSSNSAAAAAQPADAGGSSSSGGSERRADGGSAPSSEPNSTTADGSPGNHSNSTHWLTGAALPAFIATLVAVLALRRCRVSSKNARAGSLGSLPHGVYARSQLTNLLLAARRTSGPARGSATSSAA